MIRTSIRLAVMLLAAAAGLPAEDYDDLARSQAETVSADKAAAGQRDRAARAARTCARLQALIALPPGQSPPPADEPPLVTDAIDDEPDGALALDFVASRGGYRGSYAKGELAMLAAIAEQAPRWRERAPGSARLAPALDALRALYEESPLADDAAALAQRRELCRALHPLFSADPYESSVIAKRLERRELALRSAAGSR